MTKRAPLRLTPGSSHLSSSQPSCLCYPFRATTGLTCDPGMAALACSPLRGGAALPVGENVCQTACTSVFIAEPRDPVSRSSCVCQTMCQINLAVAVVRAPRSARGSHGAAAVVVESRALPGDTTALLRLRGARCTSRSARPSWLFYLAQFEVSNKDGSHRTEDPGPAEVPAAPAGATSGRCRTTTTNVAPEWVQDARLAAAGGNKYQLPQRRPHLSV